jgi:hypothetical protein
MLDFRNQKSEIKNHHSLFGFLKWFQENQQFFLVAAKAAVGITIQDAGCKFIVGCILNPES